MKALEFAAFVVSVWEKSTWSKGYCFLNKILRNHLLSEHMQWNCASLKVKSNRLMSTSSKKNYQTAHSSHPHFPHWNNPIFLLCTITELSVIAWHLLWLLTTEGKNIVKLLAISQHPYEFLAKPINSTVWFNSMFNTTNDSQIFITSKTQTTQCNSCEWLQIPKKLT